MERRDFITTVGMAAVLASSSRAFAQTGDTEMAKSHSMHAAKYKALQDASGHCVGTDNDCIRHCIGMLAMNDYTMTGCIDTAYQVVAACGALQALAAVNSVQVPAFAKATAAICTACQKQCEKYLDIVECKACAESCKTCAAECNRIAA
jgi:Cys-rich four helix bundle protein (predicted Tat secretion target)